MDNEIASATNALDTSLSSRLSRESHASTNYTDAATNALDFALRGEIVAATNAILTPDYSTANTQLVATIETVAPAPGNYNVVSNRAMNALVPAEDNMIVFGGILDVSVLNVGNNISMSARGYIDLDGYAKMHWDGFYNFSGTTQLLLFPWALEINDNTIAVLGDIATATNTLNTSLSSRLSQESRAATNYTDSAIASADTSYTRTTTITNGNQTVAYVTNAPNNTLTIELPTSGETKDWIVYAYFGAETPLALPSSVTWWMADESYTNAIPSNTPTALYFSQVAPSIFTLSRQELQSINIPTP